ncbi:MAG: GHKL domain-containing protein [Candidatus Lokiarchaeota archaeon]|nr:GHKL domain-containing protein [Candidatus Lokiarchaeota archaeon]
MKFKFEDERIRVFIIIILIIISCILIYYFEIVLGTTLLIALFFYLPSILACIWWNKKGITVPCFLSVILIIFHLIQDPNIFSPVTINNLLRAFSLIIVGTVVALLSEQLSNREYELNDIIEDLKRSNEDLQQFAYVASHDLQEPLRAITSFSQLLEEKYQDKIDKDGKEFLYFITDGAKKMNNLIKDLLLYSRITTHAQPPTPNNLEIILKDALFNLHEAIKESGATITYDKLPILTVDKTQFLQLFQNFVSNAIKFRREEPPKIHIRAELVNNEWLFSIKDNGIGIESKYFDRLYNIFYRLHTKEEYPGTGIGLPICKKIVQRYGGKVWVESELGKGSTFYFTIPIKKLKTS